MEELCRSIERQNVTMLTNSSAAYAPSPPHVTTPHQQACVESLEEQKCTGRIQDSPDNGEKPIKAHVSMEAGKRARDDASISFADGLSAYIPVETVLMRSIRERIPQSLFVNERYSSGCEIHDLNGGVLQDLYAKSASPTGGALIVQDINQEWAEILHAGFPESVHSTFLAEHMIRLDDTSATDTALEQLKKDIASSCPDTKMERTCPDNDRFSVEFEFPSQSPNHKGLHVDFLFETAELDRLPSDLLFSDRSRRNVFEKDASDNWRRISHRVSWCRLGGQFNLILVDTSPGFDTELSWNSLREDPFKILLDPRIDASKFWTQSRMAIQYASWDGPDNCLKSMMAHLFQHHTVNSVFAPVAVPVKESHWNLKSQRHGVEPSFDSRTVEADDCSSQLTSSWGNRQILVWLLTESAWQLAVATLESKWQRVRPRITKLAGDESFMLLTGLRRQIADAQDLIAESRESCIQTIKETRHWAVNGQSIDADVFWSGKSEAPAAAIYRHAQSMDIRNLPNAFEKMEERVGAMTRAINQEIQVVIGSVQVEDAKTMKRQTEWMVALALLAAVYLPMTLVTGIFGMNISEINADKTLPSRWAAVKAWGIVFGATLGCILVYAMARRPIRWLLDRRELAKLQAMDIEALKVD